MVSRQRRTREHLQDGRHGGLFLSYERLARYYDWEHAEFDADLSMYLDFARETRGSLLDLACGTGRVTRVLAGTGRRVVGVDSSRAMLETGAASMLPEIRAGRVALAAMDMRHLALRGRFGLALVALGSFHHLLTREDQLAALTGIREVLSSAGLLVVDLINPTPDWLAAGDGALVLQRSSPYTGPGGPGVLSKFVARTAQFETQIDRSVLLYDLVDPRGALTRLTVSMEMRLLFRYEAELLLERAGFKVRELLGDYSLEQYGSSSPRMIFVAEKR